MTLSVLEGHSPMQAFSSAIFRICGASRGPSASAELLIAAQYSYHEQLIRSHGIYQNVPMAFSGLQVSNLFQPLQTFLNQNLTKYSISIINEE